ncbi:hypothetical protein ACH4U5_02680 [Streptomyces sp. NPDC020858]|uniref:hypothetical protein n=1 Tax=Streptomyces sp. NPDC020858 TaxID=3365097 RepID=UPI0037A6437E
MQLRRAVPLSLVALLASAGCVSVGPQDAAPVPVRGAVPPAGAPDVPSSPSPLPLTALPLGELPAPATHGPDPMAGQVADPVPEANPEPARERTRTKAAPPPRRKRQPGPTTARPRRRPVPPPPADELCAAAEGVVPPSIVDLCLRQYDR